MRRVLKIFVLSLLCFFVIASSAAFAKEPLRVIAATVMRVSDGDTVVAVDANGTKLRVRLYGLDAPETVKLDHRSGRAKMPGQPFGDDAERELKEKVMGKRVELRIMDIDRYKRLVSVIVLDGRDINLETIREGFAEAYVEYLRGPFRDKYIEAESLAKKERRGIWGLSNYERPSDFRRRLRVSGD